MSSGLPLDADANNGIRPSEEFEENNKAKNKAQRKLESTIKDHNLTNKQVGKYLEEGWEEYRGTPYGGRFYTDPEGYFAEGLQLGYLTAQSCHNLIDDIEAGKVADFLEQN